MLDKNPFRRPAQSKGEQVVLAPPLSPPLPPLPPEEPTSGLSSQPSSSHAIPPPTSLTPPFDDDELPPPYTPAANLAMGEETVGLGPRRPFQPAPQAPSSSAYSPSNSRSPSNQPPPAHPVRQQLTDYGIQSAPAPWQTRQQYRQRQLGGGGLLGTLFGAFQEIADAVSSAHHDQTMATQRANASAYVTPYPSTGSSYAPPPGPPGQVQRSVPPRPASTPPRSPSSVVPDDGTPTRTPMPGHPLLRDGNLLVYPKDYLCVKCKNTGYKNYDPSHPCSKCWEKYGKPYTGALSYTPWSPSGNDPRMQRALPRFVPPHLAGMSSPGSGAASRPRDNPYAPPHQHLHHSRSVSQPPYMGSAGPGLSYYVIDPLDPVMTPPVPHAIPVNPGDPRLGGRLCMGCHGAGYKTIMLIDVMTCETCGGTGRVWI